MRGINCRQARIRPIGSRSSTASTTLRSPANLCTSSPPTPSRSLIRRSFRAAATGGLQFFPDSRSSPCSPAGWITGVEEANTPA